MHKVDSAVVNATGVVLDKAPKAVSGSEDVKIGGEEKSQAELEEAELYAAAVNALDAYEAAVEELEAKVDAAPGAFSDAKNAAIAKATEASKAVNAYADDEVAVKSKATALNEKLGELDGAKAKAIKIYENAAGKVTVLSAAFDEGKVNFDNLTIAQTGTDITITGDVAVKVTAGETVKGFGLISKLIPEGAKSEEYALVAWMIGEEEHVWIIGNATETFEVTYEGVVYTIDVSDLDWK